MTKAQILAKVNEMKPDILELIDNRVEKALASGTLNIEDYEDNFILPKIIVSAIGSEIEFQYRPYSKEHIRTRNNLKQCL